MIRCLYSLEGTHDIHMLRVIVRVAVRQKDAASVRDQHRSVDIGANEDVRRDRPTYSMAKHRTCNDAVPSRDGVNAGRRVSTGRGVASAGRMPAAMSLRLRAHGDHTVRAGRDECENDNRSARHKCHHSGRNTDTSSLPRRLETTTSRPLVLGLALGSRRLERPAVPYKHWSRVANART